MIILNPVPTIPDQTPEIRYSVPMFLWLQENNQVFMNNAVCAVEGILV